MQNVLLVLRFKEQLHIWESTLGCHPDESDEKINIMIIICVQKKNCKNKTF